MISWFPAAEPSDPILTSVVWRGACYDSSQIAFVSTAKKKVYPGSPIVNSSVLIFLLPLEVKAVIDGLANTMYL